MIVLEGEIIQEAPYKATTTRPSALLWSPPVRFLTVNADVMCGEEDDLNSVRCLAASLKKKPQNSCKQAVEVFFFSANRCEEQGSKAAVCKLLGGCWWGGGGQSIHKLHHPHITVHNTHKCPQTAGEPCRHLEAALRFMQCLVSALPH